MSKYFETLGRLKRENWAETPLPDRELVTPERTPAAPGSKRTVPGLSVLNPDLQDAGSLRSLSSLLDSIRALTHSSATPGAVIAGVANSAPVEALLDGTRLLAQQKGIQVFTGELTVSEGNRRLSKVPRRTGGRTAQGATPGHLVLPMTSDLDLSSGWEDATRWIESASDGVDLLILKAPPILEVVDGALLAKSAGGLILVVELLRTSRSDLKAAVERAKTSGCPILGIVTVGNKSRVPGWVAHLLPGNQESSLSPLEGQ